MSEYKLVPAELIDQFPEINPSNYGHDDACALNAWGVELVKAATATPDVQGEPVDCEDCGGDGEVWHESGAYAGVCATCRGNGQVDAPQPAEQQPAPDVSRLVKALESMINGYVRLLESGMDRITSLGGLCDPVDVMERHDPYLRDARAELATHRKGGE